MSSGGPDDAPTGPFGIQAFSRRRASRMRERLWFFVAGVVAGNVGWLLASWMRS